MTTRSSMRVKPGDWGLRGAGRALAFMAMATEVTAA